MIISYLYKLYWRDENKLKITYKLNINCVNKLSQNNLTNVYARSNKSIQTRL